MKNLPRLYLIFVLLITAGCGPPDSPPKLAPPVVRTVMPIPTAPDSTEPPVPTIEPTPLPAPSATPEGRLGPDNLPDNVNPLTGEVVNDPAGLDHRPLAVKIVNQPPCARPQAGLNQAALVFEHYVEAWGTRFTAIFYGSEVERVGAIRSARLIDLELPAIFDALLITSGSSGGVKQRLLASDFASRLVSAELGADCPPLCRVPAESVPCQDTEHTMFTSTGGLHSYAAQAGLDARPALTGWAFSPALLNPGRPADRVHVGYLNSPVDWTYDAESGNYLRSQNGNRQVDALTSLRLTAANVVVLFAHHLYSDIRESTNFYSLEIQFWGQGRALIFRDGQIFEGQWLRPQRAGLFQLADASGAPIPLKPGRTWFEFVALDSAVDMREGGWAITATTLPEQTPPKP